MYRLLKVVVALLCAVGLPAFALTTGTVTDLDGQTWNNGTWSVELVSPNDAPTINGIPQTTTSAPADSRAYDLAWILPRACRIVRIWRGPRKLEPLYR